MALRPERRDVTPLPDLLHGRSRVGPVRQERPVYVDLLPPCNAGCQEAEQNARLADAGTGSFAESLSYFPADADSDPGPRRYLSLLERAAAAVDVLVIGSLNGVTPGGWTSYARAIQDAGAAAIELNI
jgi:hypothetical protein